MQGDDPSGKIGMSTTFRMSFRMDPRISLLMMFPVGSTGKLLVLASLSERSGSVVLCWRFVGRVDGEHGDMEIGRGVLRDRKGLEEFFQCYSKHTQQRQLTKDIFTEQINRLVRRL